MAAMNHGGGRTRQKARLLLLLPLAAAWSCAHAGIREVGQCDQVPAEQRVACAACTVKNEAKGWIGDYEYRPDNGASDRCVRVK